MRRQLDLRHGRNRLGLRACASEANLSAYEEVLLRQQATRRSHRGDEDDLDEDVPMSPASSVARTEEDFTEEFSCDSARSFEGAASLGSDGELTTAAERHPDERHHRCLLDDEETVLLSRARQTVDFVDKQRRNYLAGQAYSSPGGDPRPCVSARDALELLSRVRLPSGATARDAGFTCCALARSLRPRDRPMHLAALVHGLGLLSVLEDFGGCPDWAALGETFPVGCKFSEDISFSQYFCSNPDRRKRVFNRPLGCYRKGCGLGSVKMSWGPSEYLHTVLTLLNGTRLDQRTLFLIRHQKFYSLETSRHYRDLLSAEDAAMADDLWLFQRCTREASSAAGRNGAAEDASHVEYCEGLLEEFLPNPLEW